ncbi:TolC family protein [Hydrogenimonas sp.]
MKPLWPALILFFALLTSLEAASIGELLEALKKHPVTKQEELGARDAALAAEKAEAALLPKAELFATYEHYNSPTNLRPMSPLESAAMLKEKKPLPFATTIERIGARVSMPLFSKSLYGAIDAACAASRSQRARHRLELLKNEAVVVGANARWRYLEATKAALEARRRSIRKLADDTRVAVESGRAPGVSLDKLEAAIEGLDMAALDLEAKELAMRERIEALTGLSLKAPAAMAVQGRVEEGALFAARPQKEAAEAKRHALEAAKGRLWPKLSLGALWSENYGQNAERYPGTASDDVHRGYGNYMLSLSMPLFDKGAYTGIEEARIGWERERMRLAATTQKLEASAKRLKREIALRKKAAALAKKRIVRQEALLRYARVALETGRMIEEEYLRYEEALLSAQSALHEARAAEVEAVAQLAVIYGRDLEEIFE